MIYIMPIKNQLIMVINAIKEFNEPFTAFNIFTGIGIPAIFVGVDKLKYNKAI